MNTMHAIGSNDFQKIIWMSLFVPGLNGRRGIPYIQVGVPGTAKTSVTAQLARAAGLHYEAVLGSLRSPLDFLGVPFLQTMPRSAEIEHLLKPDEDGLKYAHQAPVGFALRAAIAKRSLIHLDEVSACSAAVQSALLRVLFEGIVGELDLGPLVRFVLSMNPLKMSTGGREITMPMANRMGWLEWPFPTVAEFTDFMLSNGTMGSSMNAEGVIATAPIDPEGEEMRVDEEWPEVFAKHVGDTIGFLQRFEDLLTKPAAAPSCPWPSGRTWELSTRAAAGCEIYGLGAEAEALACGAYTSPSVYSQFAAWRVNADLPSPGELLDGRAHFNHDPSRLDRSMAVLTACASLVTPEGAEKRKERSAALWQLVSVISKDAVDVCVPTVTALCKSKLIVGSKVGYKVLASMEPVLSAAGINKV